MMSVPFPRRVIRFALGVIGGGGMIALASGAEPLARSPFLPPPTGPVAEVAVTENAPLQFCGVIGEGEDAIYNVFNPAKRRSQWVKVGQETETFTLRSFDADAETVVVAQGGQVMTLRLQAAQAASGPGASVGPLPIAGAGNGQQNALTASVKVNPTPADEARRLEAVAAEVRRRRALRQAATEQSAQSAAGNR